MQLQVGVKALLQNKDGKYLIIRRNPVKYPEAPNRWDIVGGRINPGAPLFDNLKNKKNKKRTAYKDWGKNPFSVSKAAIASVAGPQGTRLGGIIYDANDVCALINDELVHKGDSVDGKKVVEIHRDRVVLNDGIKDIELRLEE